MMVLLSDDINFRLKGVLFIPDTNRTAVAFYANNIFATRRDGLLTFGAWHTLWNITETLSAFTYSPMVGCTICEFDDSASSAFFSIQVPPSAMQSCE